MKAQHSLILLEFRLRSLLSAIYMHSVPPSPPTTQTTVPHSPPNPAPSDRASPALHPWWHNLPAPKHPTVPPPAFSSDTGCYKLKSHWQNKRSFAELRKDLYLPSCFCHCRCFYFIIICNEIITYCPGRVAQLVGASLGTPERFQVDPQSRHIPRLRFWSPVGATTGGNRWMFLSHINVSLSFHFSLSKIYKPDLGWGLKKEEILPIQYLFYHLQSIQIHIKFDAWVQPTKWNANQISMSSNI